MRQLTWEWKIITLRMMKQQSQTLMTITELLYQLWDRLPLNNVCPFNLIGRWYLKLNAFLIGTMSRACWKIETRGSLSRGGICWRIVINLQGWGQSQEREGPLDISPEKPRVIQLFVPVNLTTLFFYNSLYRCHFFQYSITGLGTFPKKY